jgi:microcystin-dependent protein
MCWIFGRRHFSPGFVAGGLVVTLLAILSSATAHANPPRQIPYSGQLELNGAKVSGPVDLVFYLVDDAAKGRGDALWTESHNGVTVYGGAFAVVLGSLIPLSPEILARPALYLGIEVNGVALGGRKRLLPTPYSVESLAVPPGTVVSFAGTTAPEGWLLCDGSEQLKAVYPRLAAVLGTTYGAGTSTTFRLPDLRGRLALGKDDMGGTAAGNVGLAAGRTLGGRAGEERTAELANHTHPITPGGGHNHMLKTACGGVCFDSGDGMARGNANLETTYFSTLTTPNHDHGGNTQNGGTGATANNMPPYLTLNYIVKY